MSIKLKTTAAVFISCVVAFISDGCNKKLEEHPYTAFTLEFFKTPSGLQSGINSLYSGMRFAYGTEPGLAITVMGTDEFTGADQVTAATGGQYVRSFALYGGNTPIAPSDGSLLSVWNSSFTFINTANAIVEFAPEVDMDATLKTTIVAEARFLRGLYYLNLVQQFGAVPVDLGSGDLKFNQVPYQGFNRLSINDVLTKDYNVMIADFIYASQNLPDKRPSNAFKLSKAVAFAMLAKTYIFRGYSSNKQATDFPNAYTAAMQVINNQSLYGVALQQDYGRVHAQGNDYNSEILYSVERLPNDLNNNETPISTNTAGKGNNASVDFAPNYTGVTNAKAPGVGRQALYGRPYRRFAPTTWLLNTAFADKYNDSRFDNSFRVMWNTTANTPSGGRDGGPINYGDTAFYIAVTQRIADSMNLLAKPYPIIPPSQIWTLQNLNPQCIYPYLQKYADSAKANFNDVVSGRPFVVSKLSEVYLLAAEAAMQGAGGGVNEAATLINALRARAAYRPSLTALQVSTRANSFKISGSDINLDFILDERTRELCGESVRWPDLAMRGKLVERVKKYNPDAGPNIQPFHALRPIPQTQLDAITVPDKNIYQNTGYNQ